MLRTHRPSRPGLETLEDRCLLSGSPLSADADRSLTTPAAWYMFSNVSASFLAGQIQQHNLRIVDLEVNNSAGDRFSATLVQNTGDFGKGWWWYYGQTGDQLAAHLNDNHARLIDLEVYTVNGQQRFAGVMVDNTGAAAKGWWWYYNASPSFLSDALTRNNARLIDLGTSGSNTYSAVMVSNTGSDAKAWWYYYNQTPSQVSTLLNQNHARLIDIEADSSGRFDVVMVKNTGSTSDRWWWYYGFSAQNILDTANRNGARVFDLEPYSARGSTLYAGLMLDDVNSLSDTVGDVLRGANASGQVGLYLKRIGGPVLADLQSGRQFEPASMIKVVLYLTALRRVEAGTLHLTDSVNWYYQPGDNINNLTKGNPGVNPDSFNDTASNRITEPLGVVLDRMMKESDNRATRAIDKLLGRPAINATAAFLGMKNTVFASTLGSGIPGNYLTLADAGLLYEKVESGQILHGAYLTDFRRLMTNESTQDPNNIAFPDGVFGAFVTVVRQEAARKLNKPLNDPAVVALTNQFVGLMKNNWKGGGYDLYNMDAGHAHIDRTVGGYVALPVKNGTAIGYRSYVYGIFIENAVVPRNGADDSGPALDQVNQAWANSQGELLRLEIRSALATF